MGNKGEVDFETFMHGTVNYVIGHLDKARQISMKNHEKGGRYQMNERTGSIVDVEAPKTAKENGMLLIVMCRYVREDCFFGSLY
jgi:hypothetical protein